MARDRIKILKGKNKQEKRLVPHHFISSINLYKSSLQHVLRANELLISFPLIFLCSFFLLFLRCVHQWRPLFLTGVASVCAVCRVHVLCMLFLDPDHPHESSLI